ncbi:MAG: PD-(D/E)XK nuclease family protein [Parcubacteria group bacterium]|nr:PD-(D/E)XK nuclease family protein [Parcubacteria group bacterium]
MAKGKEQSGKRTRNIFNSASTEPFKLSRSKLELFKKCERCFYLDRRLGVGQPPGFPFNLNSAVDHLLKKEFDVHRAKKSPHPLMAAYGIDAVPFDHPEINRWRENFVGVQYHHGPSNFLVTGAVDDVWIGSDGKLIVVDYKATSKDSEVNLDAEWQDGYKRQMEIYQWLLRGNGFNVSDTGYFVYANGRRDKEAFDGKLEFNVKIIPYKGSGDWVEAALLAARYCLENDFPPKAAVDCEYCAYRKAAWEAEERKN